MSRGSSWGKKVSWKTTIVYQFSDLMRIIFGHSINFFDELVKTAFYVSRKTFCRKKLILQFHVLGDMFRDFWQETRTTLSFFQNCTLRVEREYDRNSLALFFTFSAGSPNWALALWSKFQRKNTFQENNIYIHCFRTLTELYLRVQRNVLFRNTVLEFFSSVHDFESKICWIWQNFSDLFFETAFYVTTGTFKRMFFFLEKPNTCLTFSNFEQKRPVVWLVFYSRTVKNAFHVSKWTLRVKIFFKKSFSSFLLDSDEKICAFCQSLFASFIRTASTCP